MDPLDFENSIRELATQVDERPPLQVDALPPPKKSRVLLGAIGLATIVLIGVGHVAIMKYGEQLGAPPPPPEDLAALEADPCLENMGLIMAALTRYTHDRGAPPQRLSDLEPDYLPAAPLDPVSRRPYEYAVAGESVTLACPVTGPPQVAQQ